MTLRNDGLTDIGMGAGLTTNFQVQYDDRLYTSATGIVDLVRQANIIANANALLAVIENEFIATTGSGWFNIPSGKFGTGHRQVVNLSQDDGSGATNWGYGGVITLDAQSGNNNSADAAEIVRMLFMAEWSEVLMDVSGKWNRGDSSGEGLSQYCAISRFQAGHNSYYDWAASRRFVEIWLNARPPYLEFGTERWYVSDQRHDWVNATESTDRNIPSFGCALAFIYYLNVQLNFSIDQIIADGATDLATTYRTLTGDPGNPFPFFAGLLEHVYPSSVNANIPGPVPDNPFPLAQLSFWMDKDTFGKDEVQDVINTNAGKWEKTFWLVIEGFSKNSYNALGVTIPPLSGPFSNLAGITITQNPDIDFENTANPKAPQRIRVPFDVTFTNAALTSDFPASGSQVYELDASLTIAGNKVPGSDASTLFELVPGADPYFTNMDPAQNNVFYLSQDLRVFTATPAQNSVPVQGGPSFTDDSVAGAFSYIQNLLKWLNNPDNHFSDGTNDPFASGVIPQPLDSLNGDSSVTPFSADQSNNYNFAVARVRLRGPSGSSGAANNVRVFFRLWSTETADTDYQIGSTYPSTMDSAGYPISPLVGIDHHTTPIFASGNLSDNTDYATNGANISNIEIPAGKDIVWHYYGCFLNLYDQANIIDGKAVQAWLQGTHHCIVAQIAYDGAPVIPGASPESSDKLAQRNLQVTHSDNPGPADTHRIPQTFDIRPTTPIGPSAYPDELMIDWGTIPLGSVAYIYWPQVLANDVLALASELYGSHTLSIFDSHTVQCKITGGVTYIPIPTGASENFAGLLTLDLPTTVVIGQEFNVVVRRISTRQYIPGPEIKLRTVPASSAIGTGEKLVALRKPEAEAIKVAVPPQPRSWRYVVGTFQIKIPVSSGDAMLYAEENTLSIMRWRLEQMAPSDRWHPVLERYISYIAARVDGLGGDSSEVVPSPNGQWRETISPRCKALAFINAVLLAALVTALGTIGGNLTLIIAILLVVLAITWAAQCHPRVCSLLRTYVAGAGCGALILAILALFGMYSQMLVSVLAATIILVAIGAAVGVVRKCF